MISLSIKDDLRRLTSYLNKVERKVVPRATVQALNKTIRTVKSRSVRAIAKETGIKAKIVRSRITLHRATIKQQAAFLDARKGKARNLIEFVSKAQARPSGGAGSPQHFRKRLSAKGKSKGAFRFKGVQAKAWGKKEEYNGAFIAKSRRGNVLVFKRQGAGRRKITSLAGPSIRRTFIRDRLTTIHKRIASERFTIEMNRALRLGLTRLS